MRKIWNVLKTEFINTFTRRSFLLTLILVPLVPALILGSISLIGGDAIEESTGEWFQPPQEDHISEGYIDRSGIITEIPDWLDKERLISFENESQARDAVIAGDIVGYYVIQNNYIETGDIRYVRKDFNPMSSIDTAGVINAVIQYNLLGSNEQRFQTFLNPVHIQRVNLTPEEAARDMSNPLAFFLPYGVTMLFYILIVTSASMMMNSIAKEKENRVMEILLSSLKPNQLLTGKILGLGLIGILQLTIWMGSAIIMLRLGGTTLNIPPNLQLPPSLLIWGIAFFVLGYLVYATIMAGVGALVPNVKEASQATFIIILPILVPLLMIGMIINNPNAPLPIILSLIPFTAPNTMMTRLAVGPVPLWQLSLSIGLLVFTIIILIRMVASMFRTHILLTGKKFSFWLFIRALFGQVGQELDLTES